MTTETCEGCRYFKPRKPEDYGLGFCRRFPPIHQHESPHVANSFPWVNAGDWCGEHAEASAEATRPEGVTKE
jgi:hypothetical protein